MLGLALLQHKTKHNFKARADYYYGPGWSQGVYYVRLDLKTSKDLQHVQLVGVMCRIISSVRRHFCNLEHYSVGEKGMGHRVSFASVSDTPPREQHPPQSNIYEL